MISVVIVAAEVGGFVALEVVLLRGVLWLIGQALEGFMPNSTARSRNGADAHSFRAPGVHKVLQAGG